MADFDEALMVALDRLEPGTWAVVFKDSTSPKLELVILSEEVLDRGIGEVGSINIPPFVWHVSGSRGVFCDCLPPFAGH